MSVFGFCKIKIRILTFCCIIYFSRTVEDFRQTKNGCSVVEICNELIENFDKDYPLAFYSRELLFSDKARAEFVEADLKTI